jgi:hypothetical protein
VINPTFKLLSKLRQEVCSGFSLLWHFYVCVRLYVSDRWGRGHPEEYTEAITLGEEKFDPDSQEGKKPRAGQILWIRGLTRLQTQVSDISHSPCIY